MIFMRTLADDIICHFHSSPPPKRTNETKHIPCCPQVPTSLSWEGTKNKVLTVGWSVGDSIECYHQFYLICDAQFKKSGVF